ncbi:MAG: ParA family protein [Pirellulaceae bacterium]|nr:ParA family protein [Pirellulaceae bacterium]
MVRTICIANQKGGVGKTTTAIHLATASAIAGQRTLLVDLDPQCNATSGIGQQPLERHPLVCERPLGESIRITEVENLGILPGSRYFQDIDYLENGNASHSERLKHHLANYTQRYDLVYIDCPPSLGQLTQTALSSSSEVLMPIQCEFFAMEGLTQMIHVIKRIMQRVDNQLQFGGILLTMYEPQLELTHEVDAEVRDFFGEIVFDTVIPRDVTLSEASGHGQSTFEYAPRSRGTRAYTELCQEILEYE